MDAGMLECPNCGAPARLDEVCCAHCRVQLQTVACPACFGMVFIGAKHCSHCGARAFRTSEEMAATSGPHACPRGHGELLLSAIGEAFLEECGRCGGLWVDAESFKKICARRQASAAFVGLGSPLSAPGHAVAPELVHYVACPVCQKMMNRLNFARHSGVIVDVCKNHGTWFDKDELRRIAEFIEAGGLEAAAQKEQEKQKVDEERLRAERRDAGHPPDRPTLGGYPDGDDHPYGSVLGAAGGLLKWLVS